MYGLECLFRFFSYGLEAKFKPDLYQDFEIMTLREFQRYNGLYGLEKFWAFHHYSGLPADCTLEVHPELKALLEGPYKTLDCFREEQRRRELAAAAAEAEGGREGGGGAKAHHHPHPHPHHGAGRGHGGGRGQPPQQQQQQSAQARQQHPQQQQQQQQQQSSPVNGAAPAVTAS
jgi:hypothetical protein